MKIHPFLFILMISTSLLAANPSSSSYPLTTCVVSGDKLGAMGDPVVINYHGTEIRFCCHDCVESFNANPDKYLAKLKESTAAQATQKNNP
jgi:YHS domain-containing protein